MRLEIAHHDIVPLALQTLRFLEHLIGLADARRVAQKDGEPPPHASVGTASVGKMRTSMPSGFHDQALHRIHFPAAQPSALILLAVADEDLRDAVAVGELQNGIRWDPRHAGSRRAPSASLRGRQILLDHRLIGGAQNSLLHVNRVQIAMKQIRQAASAADHRRCVRARRDAHQNALLRSVKLLDALPPQIRFKLVIHHIGGQHQRDLAKLRELALLLRTSARNAIFRRHVHQFDLIGGADESLRHRILHLLAADRLHLRLPFLHVLQIDRSDHGDAGGEKIFDVLPALRVPAAGRIAVRQAVDQANLRMPAQHGFDIDRVDPIDDARRNHFQAAEQFFDDRGLDRLRGRHRDILAARPPPPPFVEHAKRFSDAARVAQEDFQTPLRGAALLGFHLLQKLFRDWACDARFLPCGCWS